jgi:hypothetical protein
VGRSTAAASRAASPSIAKRARLAADAAAVATLLLLGVVLPLAIGVAAGSLEVARNDDGAYRRVALEFAQTGRLSFDSRAMLFGQVVVTQPLLWLFGQPAGFVAAGVLFAAGAVLSAYTLARQLLSSVPAAAAACLLLLFPGYLAYATSYMTDAPALALQMLSLALGVVALKRPASRDRWLVAAVIAGCGGVAFRDFAIAAPAAVVAAAILAEPRHARAWALGVLTAGWYGALVLLRGALTQQGADAFHLGAWGLAAVTAMAIVALVLLPVVLWRAPIWLRESRRFDLAVGIELALVYAATRAVGWYQGQGEVPVILPNLASQWGAPQRDVAAGARPLLFDDTLWACLILLVLAATVVSAAAYAGLAGSWLRRSPRASGVRLQVLRRLGSPSGLLGLYVLAVVAGVTAYGFVLPLYDRYLWPLVVPMAILLLRGRRAEPTVHGSAARWLARLGAAAVAAVLASVSFGLAANSNAFDAALASGGQALVAAGIPADEIDAGYTWMNGHANGAVWGSGQVSASYRAFWPDFRQCGLVTSDAAVPQNARLVTTVSYRLFLFGGAPETLYAFAFEGPGCPAP